MRWRVVLTTALVAPVVGAGPAAAHTGATNDRA